MSESGAPLFAVTTRSRLKGPWLFPSMMAATLKVRRQLKAGGDVVQWASIIAGPSEFWTITIWRSRNDMQEFMRSGAHDEVMWSFSKLLRSFWLMRWRPGPYEVGSWKGVTMGQSEPAYDRAPLDAPRADALQKALDHLPKLKAATAADGSVSYESTPYARRRREEVGGAGGAVVHVRTAPRHTLEALTEMRRLRRLAERDPDHLRAVVGLARPGEIYLLGLWSDRAGAHRLLESQRCLELAQRWPEGYWANEWIPENEFGHWDGVRVRRARQRYAIPVPKAARDAAG
ncbi:MAG: hypothetical protein ABIS21_08695 [Acidimicrobiales bacterium]